MNGDDEFSSGSSDSSIDPSQLVGDLNSDAVLEIENDHDTEARNSVAADNDDDNAVMAAGRQAEASETNEQQEEFDALSPEKIKIVIGESVLQWQRQKQALSSASEPTPKGTFDYATLRDNHNTMRAPLANDAKITVTPPTATVTSGDKKYTGKFASLTSYSNPWVECIAIYDERRKAHVLEVVDWTITNLKPSSSSDPLPESAARATDPRQQQRHAEERVRDKRKHKATGSASRAKTPTPKKPKQQATNAPTDDTNNTEQSPDQSPKVKYRGVSALKRKSGTRYRAQITLEGKPTYLGTYATAEEAARRYDQVARKKEANVRLNFPETESTNVIEEKEADSS